MCVCGLQVTLPRLQWNGHMLIWPLSEASRLPLMALFIKGTDLFWMSTKGKIGWAEPLLLSTVGGEKEQSRHFQIMIFVQDFGLWPQFNGACSSPTAAEENGFNGKAVICHWSVSFLPAVCVCVFVCVRACACACVCICICVAQKHLHFAFPNLWVHTPADLPIWGKWEEQITTCLSHTVPPIPLLFSLLSSLFSHTSSVGKQL